MKFRDYSKYEVYPNGKIWSYSHKKWLKHHTNKDGYQQVCLTDNEGKKKTYFLHRVVYEAVTREQIPQGYEINHRSEAKDENMISNLELLSHKENCNFGSRNTRIANNTNRSKAISKANTNNPKRSTSVGAFKDGKLVLTFQSTAEAGRQGFKQGNVSKCCNNCFNREGNNKYKGFEWKYI